MVGNMGFEFGYSTVLYSLISTRVGLPLDLEIVLCGYCCAPEGSSRVNMNM